MGAGRGLGSGPRSGPGARAAAADAAFAAGRAFLNREGRLLERRLAARCFDGAPGRGVVDALRGYRNPDGGFGHGLEPDTICPASLPIAVEVALQVMVVAGAADRSRVLGACDFLGRLADQARAGGAVPLALPVIEAFPRAPHMTDWTYEPALNPTAGLVGLLVHLGASHDFVVQGAAWCWGAIETGALPADAHRLAEVLVFLAHAPDRNRADHQARRVIAQLPSASLYRSDPDDPAYGRSPLHIAPSPDHRWRPLIPGAAIAGHLDRLQRDQQDDGGWPITWDPPGQASRLAWRGMETLRALRTRAAYGRCQPEP